MTQRKRIPKPSWLRRIAEERINTLFLLAEEQALEGNEKLARRYVTLARRIAEKVNLKIGKLYGKKFCRKCNTFFTSQTLRVRANPTTHTIDYICIRCGYVRRYKYK